MGFEFDINEVGYETDEKDDDVAREAFMQSMKTAVKVPTLRKIQTDEVISEKKLTNDEVKAEFGAFGVPTATPVSNTISAPVEIKSTVTRLDVPKPVEKPVTKPNAEVTVKSEKNDNVPNVIAPVVTNSEVLQEKAEAEERVIERDATKMVGDYQSVMPEIPEDGVIFDAVADKEAQDYEGGIVNVTKYFEDCEYPQIHIDTSALEHTYIMTSLKALMVSQPITFKLPKGTRDPGDFYTLAKNKEATEEEKEETKRRHLSLTEVQMRDENILKFTVLVDFEDGSVVKLPGIMFSSCLNSFLEAPVFSNINKWIMLDENTKLSGDVMYALYTPIPDYTDEELWVDE